MADILEKIVAYKKLEVERYKKELSYELIRSRVEAFDKGRTESMKAALIGSSTGIIAEFKRKSPSKGWINKEASPSIVPKSYQEHGAAALSILTDTHFFGGSGVYIRNARLSKVNIPILYKNFIIDDYQIYQARLAGASAILLIAACLTKEQCSDYKSMRNWDRTCTVSITVTSEPSKRMSTTLCSCSHDCRPMVLK